MKISRITVVILSIILMLQVLAVCQLGIAYSMVIYEENAAAELYHQKSISPNGSDETWDDIQAKIKVEFSDGSWAVRIASGNVDTQMCVVVLSFLGIGLISSILGLFRLFVSRKIHQARLEEERKKKMVDRTRKDSMIRFLSNPV